MQAGSLKRAFRGGAARLACGYVKFKAQSQIGDRVTIGGTETWTAVDGTPGAGEYDIGATIADTAASLATEINADASSLVVALHQAGAAVVQLSSKQVVPAGISLAENTSEARLAVSANGLSGSTSISARSVYRGIYTLNADDMTVLDPTVDNDAVVIAAIPTAYTPILDSVGVLSSNNVCKSSATVEFSLAQVNSNSWNLLVKETSVGSVLEDGDKIAFIISA